MQNAAFPGILFFSCPHVPSVRIRRNVSKKVIFTQFDQTVEMPYTLRHLLHEWSFLPKTIPENTCAKGRLTDYME